MSRFTCNGVIPYLSALVALTIGMATPLRAQETSNNVNSSIFGTVTDGSGAVIPGVVVQVSGPALLQGSISATTDASGSYRIVNLPAGTYKLSYTKAGFSTTENAGFVLEAGFAARNDVALQLGSVSQTVEVTTQAPVIDTTTTTVSADLTRETLDNVPTTRSISAAVFMAPGLRPTNTPDVGGNQLGQQQSFGSYGFNGNTVPILDGINYLQSNSEEGTGGNSPGDFVDYDSIEELHVISIGADADVATAGTVVETIMKAGGNEFHGNAHAFGSPHFLQLTDLPATDAGQPISNLGGTGANQLQYDWDAFAGVGGRIKRDKLWFYSALHFQYRSEAVVGYKGPGGGQGFDPISDNAQDGKLTYQARDNLKFTAVFTDATKIEPQRSGGSTTAYASTSNFEDYYFTLSGEMTWTPSAKWLIDAIGGNYWQPYCYPNQAGTQVAGNPWTVNQTTGAVTGPPIITGSGDCGSHNRLQTAGSASYVTGKHSYQFGTSFFMPQGDWKQFNNHPAGNYEEYTCIVTASGGLCPFANGGPPAGTLLPYQLLTSNYPLVAEGLESTGGVYAKDIWRATKKITINYGVRFDHYRVYHNTQNEPAGPFSTGGSFPYQSDVAWNPISPRFGIAYDLTGSGKMVVRGSYGMYRIDQLGAFDISNYNPAALYTNTYTWSGDTCQVTQYTGCQASTAFLSAVAASIANPSATTFNGKNIFISTSGGITGIVNPNLKMPYFHSLTAVVERQLGQEMALRVGYVGNYEEDMYDQTFPNRPPSVYNQADNTTYPATDPVNAGKPITIYYYLPAYKATSYGGTEFVNRNGNEDHYNTIEGTLTKHKSHRWSAVADLSFTKSHQWSTSTPFASGQSAAQPVAPYQTAFPLNETWDYALKTIFTYDLPYKLTFGMNYQFLAGAPAYTIDQFSVPNIGTVSIPVNQFGSDRAPNQNIMSLRFGKIFPIREHPLEFTAELFNALNVAPGTSVNWINGTGTKTFGYVSTYVDPMIVRLGGSYSF